MKKIIFIMLVMLVSLISNAQLSNEALFIKKEYKTNFENMVLLANGDTAIINNECKSYKKIMTKYTVLISIFKITDFADEETIIIKKQKVVCWTKVEEKCLDYIISGGKVLE